MHVCEKHQPPPHTRMHTHAHTHTRAHTRAEAPVLPASLAPRLSRLKVAILGRRARRFPEKEASRAPYCRLQAVSSPVRCLLACCCEDSRRYGVQVQCDYSRKVAARREGGEASRPGASYAAQAVQAPVYACALAAVPNSVLRPRKRRRTAGTPSPGVYDRDIVTESWRPATVVRAHHS